MRLGFEPGTKIWLEWGVLLLLTEYIKKNTRGCFTYSVISTGKNSRLASTRPYNIRNTCFLKGGVTPFIVLKQWGVLPPLTGRLTKNTRGCFTYSVVSTGKNSRLASTPPINIRNTCFLKGGVAPFLRLK